MDFTLSFVLKSDLDSATRMAEALKDAGIDFTRVTSDLFLIPVTTDMGCEDDQVILFSDALKYILEQEGIDYQDYS